MKRQIIVKLATIILAALLLAALMSVSVFAATATSKVTSSGQVYRGSEITFTVSINNATGVQAIAIIPTYESSAFELVSGRWTVTGGEMSNFSVSDGDGVVAFSPATNINGSVLTFTLRAKDNAPLEITSVSAQIILNDSNGQNTISTTGSMVQIKCNHDYSDEELTYLASKATCAAAAKYYYSCKHCGARGTNTFTYGTKADHNFTKEVISTTYRKSGATCTEKAVYFYCCQTCTEKGSDTFTYGNTLNHSYTRKVTTDDYKVSSADCDRKAVYYYCCATCDAKGTGTYEYGSVLGHTGGTATCAAKALCERCQEEYGSLASHVYTDQDPTDTYLKTKATCKAAALYYKNCATCDKAGPITFSYGSKADHDFTKEVISTTYRKSGATCTEKAVYFYCCQTCTEKGSDTFTYGNTLNHSYTRKVTTDDYKVSSADCDRKAVYYYCCATCDAKGTDTYEYGSVLGHTGGTATCTAKAVCERCQEEYGAMKPHVYTEETVDDAYLKSIASCASPALYYKSCANCDKAGTATFAYGDKLDHVYIEKVSTLYLKSAVTCTSKAVYYESCQNCGAKGTDTFEAGEEPGHIYQTTWSSNSSSHWHKCSRCGDKKDSASHTPGAPATETTSQVCTICYYVINPAYGHTHNYYSEWSSDADSHWYTCSGCSEKKDNEAHVFDNDCDTTCATCGYVRVTEHSFSFEWYSDNEGHWHKCSYCGVKDVKSAHIEGADATETTAQVCTVCDYVIKEALGHTHNYGTTWEKDSAQHWHVCACGDKSDVEAHKWNDGSITKEATESEEGVKTYTCTECSVTKTESIAKLPVMHNENNNSNVSPTVWIVISAIVVVGGGAAAAAIIINRKKIPIPESNPTPTEVVNPEEKPEDDSESATNSEKETEE